MPIVPSGRRTPPGARRAALLERLRDATGPLSVPELAAAVELHPNTVRAHLEVLVREGRAERTTEVRTRRGRPRELYRATDAPGGDEGYAVLAAMLAERLAELGGPVEGVRAGHRWADAVARADAPDAVTEVVRVLSRSGFAPEVDATDGTTRTIRLRHCPFVDVARTHTDVVCGAHLGLIEGTLARLGVTAAVELVPFATPDACLARLGPRTSGG